jgi:hypothetical protein
MIYAHVLNRSGRGVRSPLDSIGEHERVETPSLAVRDSFSYAWEIRYPSHVLTVGSMRRDRMHFARY